MPLRKLLCVDAVAADVRHWKPTATSSIISGSDITVSFDTSGTATEGTDYGTISDITISAGSTTHAQASEPKFRSLAFERKNNKFLVDIPLNRNELANGINNPSSFLITVVCSSTPVKGFFCFAKSMFYGKSQVVMRYVLVGSNTDLSRLAFFWSNGLHMFGYLACAVLVNKNALGTGIGMMSGLVEVLFAQFTRRSHLDLARDLAK